MPKRIITRHHVVLYILGFLLLVLAGTRLIQRFDQAPVIYLVRHSEKMSNSKDPGLTTKGTARSLWLASYFTNKDIQCIYSTDYRRTRETAAPIARALHLSINYYDPRQLAESAQRITARHSNCVVVGHSNTTTSLARLLGADNVPTISEDDYRLIFRVELTKPVKFSVDYSDTTTTD